jgi:hypothetical protein
VREREGDSPLFPLDGKWSGLGLVVRSRVRLQIEVANLHGSSHSTRLFAFGPPRHLPAPPNQSLLALLPNLTAPLHTDPWALINSGKFAGPAAARQRLTSSTMFGNYLRQMISGTRPDAAAVPRTGATDRRAAGWSPGRLLPSSWTRLPSPNLPEPTASSANAKILPADWLGNFAREFRSRLRGCEAARLRDCGTPNLPFP